MQKQKNKSKLKVRDINRRGAEKEGTDMDAFVNTIPPPKIETKQPEIKEAVSQKDSNKESSKEITKDIKEKDNHESKKEKQASAHSQEKHTSSDVSKESTPIIEKPTAATFNHSDSKPTIEESSEPEATSNIAPIPDDVVDHSVPVQSDFDVNSIVAQKNEENAKVSALRASSEEKIPVIEKQDENAAPNQLEAAPKGPVALKYTYQDDQWSPINTEGKKVYGREFLMRLQDDPNSKIKPSNLPDLDVVLKDITKVRQFVNGVRSIDFFSELSYILVHKIEWLILTFLKIIISEPQPCRSKGVQGVYNEISRFLVPWLRQKLHELKNGWLGKTFVIQKLGIFI